MTGENYLDATENAKLRDSGLMNESEVAIAIGDRIVAEDVTTRVRRLLDSKRPMTERVLLKG